MKFLTPGSLSFSLAWKIVLIQVTMVAVGLMGMVLMYGDSDAGYIDWKTSESISKAIRVEGDTLRVDWPVLEAIAPDRPPTFWFAAADEDGRQLTHGSVPAVFRPLVDELQYLEPTDLRTRTRAAELAMRVWVNETPEGRVHFMVGGMPHRGLWRQMLVVIGYLGGWIAVPLIVITLVVAPWAIHRSLRGVNRVAAQAAAIQINERGGGLDTYAVPREIVPLVDAFNAALRRIGESYDLPYQKR